MLTKPSERTVVSPSPALRQLTYTHSRPPKLTVIVKRPLPVKCVMRRCGAGGRKGAVREGGDGGCLAQLRS